MGLDVMKFADPSWVYYVLPGGLMCLAVFVWMGIALRRRASAAWAPAGTSRMVLRGSPGGRALKLALAAGAWSCVCVGLARPQWGARTEKLPRGGTDLLVLVDVSNSMLVEDMGSHMGKGTSRLEWARRKIDVLLDEMAADPIHRVGLMPFAGEPFPLVPPTPDYEAVRFFLDDLNPRSVGWGGSNIAAAIDRASDGLKKLPGKHKAILVVSDGDAIEHDAAGAVKKARTSAREKAIEAARDARLGKGVLVFSLGVGKKDVASEVAVPDGKGGRSYVRFKDEAGAEKIATSALEESTLGRIAEFGGGVYAHTTYDESDLALLLHEGMLSGGVTGEEEAERTIPTERFRWPLLAAFVLLLVEMFVPAGGRGRA